MTTVQINLPAGYTAEAVPPDIALTSKFGRYTSSIKLDGSKLMYYRKMESYAGTFPATDYTELVNFYESIYKADHSRVVLVKKEEKRGF